MLLTISIPTRRDYDYFWVNMASSDEKTAPPPPQQQQQQPETLLYFAFGSNLSSTQMRSRCPGTKAVGLAFLPGYEFIINERGFANVVPTGSGTSTSASSTTITTATTAGDGVGGGGVYGVLYRLASPAEKERLDGYEGVPFAYEDLVLEVEQLSSSGSSGSSTTSAAVTVRALVYVDRQRVVPAAPRAEYVVRMNNGIREAVANWGLPQIYVRDVMRRYIPADADADDAAGEGGETAAGLG
ncbi:hypothetical protein F5883DRAFT_537731 [Diaporthe sp. PMI_573]|nr:hypothetical protein F5883DRAFT_537731 [Diaporthaceae sp. PMI_573]